MPGPTPRAIAQRRTEGRAHDPAVARQAAVTTARTRRTGARNTPPSGKGTRRSRYEHGSPTNPPPVKTPPAGDETSTHEPDGTQHAERAAATSEHAREPERYATGGALSRKRNRFDDAYAPLTVRAGTSPRHAVSIPYGHGGAPVDDARPCVATRARALARPSRSPHATAGPAPDPGVLEARRRSAPRYEPCRRSAAAPIATRRRDAGTRCGSRKAIDTGSCRRAADDSCRLAPGRAPRRARAPARRYTARHAR